MKTYQNLKFWCWLTGSTYFTIGTPEPWIQNELPPLPKPVLLYPSSNFTEE